MLSVELEYTCPSCHRLQPADSFYKYNELYTSGARTIRRRQVDHCVFCRANRLVETNQMPEDLAAPELDESGVWDYTVKYRAVHAELARAYAILETKPVLQQRAEAEAVKRRVTYVKSDLRMLEVHSAVIPKIYTDQKQFDEWLLMNGICMECYSIKSAFEFIVRKKRGHGHRYEFKQRCNGCRQKYITGPTAEGE